MRVTEKTDFLTKAYDVPDTDAARTLYDDWAPGYEDELTENGYVTPKRCAEALMVHAEDPAAPLIEFGCGTGLGGLALRKAGFSTIDGVDLSPAMLEQATAKGIYRKTGMLDLSQPIDIAPGTYRNAAAIGVLNTGYMPPTVIDAIVAILPTGGCFVFSINDHTARDGLLEARIIEVTENMIAGLIFKDHGDHIPGTGLQSTVYVLKKL